MNDILVSIIVPIYNVQKYVEKCVTSLINQDHKNIEIILVDDGSPDNSGFIADELSKKEKRITVIHQKNQGVSAARNAGIEASKGSYIMFVDGDDWVDVNYVSYFLNLAIEKKSEIAVNVNNYRADNEYVKIDEQVLIAEKCIEGIYSGLVDVAVWNKIYSKKVIDDNAIRFNTEIWYGEGMLFNIEFLQCVDHVAVGNKLVYHQTFNPESAMRRFNLESNKCGIRSLEIQKQKWKKKTSGIEAQWQYHKYRFNRSILNGIIRSRLDSEYPEELKRCIHEIRRDIRIPLKTEKNSINKINWLCYYCFPKTMAKRAARKFYNSIKK